MMEVTKSQKRLFIVLGAAIAFLIYDIVTDFDTYAGFYGGNKKSNTVKVASAKEVQKKIDEAVSKRQYLDKWGRNPFYVKVEKKAKRVVKKEPKITFTLHAVSIKGNNSVALINDKIAKVGDMISGYTLKKIEEKQVTLSDGQKTITVKLATY